MCYTLELIQTLYAQNDKGIGVDFYNWVFPGEAKMCLGFMNFFAHLLQHSLNMQPIITYFLGRLKFMKRHSSIVFSK